MTLDMQLRKSELYISAFVLLKNGEENYSFHMNKTSTHKPSVLPFKEKGNLLTSIVIVDCLYFH